MSPLLPSVFILGVAGVAVLVALGLLVRRIFFGYPAPSAGCTLLSRKEQAIVAACANTLFPAGGPIPLSGTEAGAVLYMDRYIGRISANQRGLIRLLLHAVEHTPWVFGPTWARFTRLSAAEQVAVLQSMSTSRIYFRRVMFLSLRVILTMGYLANDEVARRIGMVFRSTPFDVAPAPVPSPDRERSTHPGADRGPHPSPEIGASRQVLA
jgi:hypothetical protein